MKSNDLGMGRMKVAGVVLVVVEGMSVEYILAIRPEIVPFEHCDIRSGSLMWSHPIGVPAQTAVAFF